MPPWIDAVTVDGRRLKPAPGLTLPSRFSTLGVEFGTINLTAASKLQFRYMLDGVDADWVYAGNAREAKYTSLPAGEHRFRVSATSTGPWTESATWAFVVTPPLYLTRRFFALAGGGIALMVVAAWWLRLRAVRNQYALVFAERARVSREIHDTLLQSLAAIGVELETIATELEPSQNTARDALRRLRRRVSRSVREARESILELRQNPMRQRGLADALRDLALQTMKTGGIPTELSLVGRPRKEDPDVDLQLLRIAQEAVQNVIKHARAGRIEIALAYEPHRVVLRVADDGCGFVPEEYDPPPASGERLGLVTMRERAARVRGTVTIRSHPGSGTSVETAVPLASS
jgi:signal transduction histidine kinase